LNLKKENNFTDRTSIYSDQTEDKEQNRKLRALVIATMCLQKSNIERDEAIAELHKKLLVTCGGSIQVAHNILMDAFNCKLRQILKDAESKHTTIRCANTILQAMNFIRGL
jgi:hypothetical protein